LRRSEKLKACPKETMTRQQISAEQRRKKRGFLNTTITTFPKIWELDGEW
jgi:hypothetical protein